MNFRKEIEKNLIFIKKKKESERNRYVYQKLRYTPRNESEEEFTNKSKRKNAKFATEESEIFSKINEIIAHSESKSAHLIEQPKNVSFSSQLNSSKLDRELKKADHATHNLKKQLHK